MTDALRQLVKEFQAELQRIGAINTAEERPRTIPELTAFRFVQQLEALLAAGGSVAPKDFEALGECYRKLTDEAPE